MGITTKQELPAYEEVRTQLHELEKAYRASAEGASAVE
jgi:hypothetical protein